METKLTLKLDEDVIRKAKAYAKSHNLSLSKVVESCLGLLVGQGDKEESTPLVKSLSGIVSLPKNFEAKTEYRKHVVNKYKA